MIQPLHYNTAVLQRNPFAFELFFFWANARFFTFSAKTRSMLPTSNLCRNIKRPKNQLNQYFSATCIRYLERTDKIHQHAQQINVAIHL